MDAIPDHQMDSNVMKYNNNVVSTHDYDYVSWYIYFDQYAEGEIIYNPSNARVLVYHDFSSVFLIYKGTDHIVRTRSLSLAWISWS
jgi:hypothetical protein